MTTLAEELYDELGPEGVLLFDDDAQSPGERFAECDLLGLPATVIVGNTYRETGLVEIEGRDGETRRLAPEEVPAATTEFGNRASAHREKAVGEYYYGS